MDFQLSDFINQVPRWIILAPIVLAIIYGVMMFIIIRRARTRRRARTTPPVDPTQLATDYASYGGSAALPMAQPATSLSTTALQAKNTMSSTNTMPSANPSASQPHATPNYVAQITGNSLPEPDFDELMPRRNQLPETGPLPSDNPERDESLPMPSFPDQYRSAPLPAAEPPVITSGGYTDSSDAVEVMRILRDLSNGKLLIEIGGRRYRSPAEIPNSELARRFQSVMRELNAMLSPASTTAIRRPAVEGGAQMPDIKMSSQPPTQVESPLSLRRVTGGAIAAQPEALNRGIADQIENYLQYKLANTSEFQHRNIHIRPTVEGGVQIEVDNQVFHAIDAVSDPDVRAFLMSTMREWEARQ